MRKISFWRYSAVNRQTLFTALACALLLFSMLGCGISNKLQSIQLSVSSATETPGSSLDLVGIGGTKQLYVWGNYSNGKHLLLNNRDAAFQVVLTPGSSAWTGTLGDPNANPAQTVQLSPNGLLTAVTPFACSWFNNAVPPATKPAWSVIGTYTVTATYSGFTSPPAYVAVASAAGIPDSTNPTGACGPDQ
jgi:hypothetical protein